MPLFPPKDRHHRKRLSAGRITTTYAACVSAWIILSDRLLEATGLQFLQTYKGLAFVAVSSAALYAYLRKKMADQATIERQLQAYAESKTRLLSSVSHDLRQPLQSLSLFASVIAGDATLGPRSRMAIDNLGQSVARMGQLLDAVLKLVEIDVGQVEVRTQPVSLSPLFAELVREMSPQAAAKGLQLKWVATRSVVESDPILLLTVLRNLVANAIRYTESGKILVGCRAGRTEVEIRVYDTGIGITDDKMKLIFEEFYQVGNQERDSRLGLGLGLSIVDRLTRLLGHRITVRSQVGKGSVFCVTASRAAAP